MKPSQLLKLFLTVTTISNFSFAPFAMASRFGETEVNRDNFVVVAAPYRHGYNLLILEQIPGQRPCWSEAGASPTVIQPLFLDFDFTNSCIRSSDSNSYSIRFQGEDYGMDYLLNVVEREEELHLVGTPRDSSKPELHLGKTNGLASGSLKIELNSKWRLTKRNYNGSTTAHLYVSNSPYSHHNNIQRQSANQFANSTVDPRSAYVGTTRSQFVNNSYQQPVTYPVQSQPVNSGYQQPITYPAQQQPVNYGYQQPVTYPVQSQPVNNGYQQPVSYPAQQQPVNNGYQQPTSYPVQQQPVNNGYQQPTSYPVQPQAQPVNTNEQKAATYQEASAQPN